jgi:hypothetical protein
MSTTPGEDEAYARGMAAGTVEERLREYGRHFDRINGSIDHNTEVLNELVLAVQQLRDAAAAERRNVVTTAAALRDTVSTTASALKDADQARRDKSDQTWTPLARLLAVLGGLAALAAVVGLIVAIAK